ncbi:hypothetical protein IFM89_016403 [Coptis chinensis]|uniref:Bet v I/Major latex protein domain-containing protein n=1 Tax=Coptis chinensis TaxID=261450 RepID=A0A835LLV2_9MAGN|nr:hypothetical protein IFM89_016403 [Coptis chinensis]
MGVLEFDVEVKSPADKFWRGLEDSATIFPKIFPERIKSVEIVEGDGLKPGSIRILKYVEGTPGITFAKEKMELLDDENKTLVYSVIDGEITHLYKSFKVHLHVVPKEEGSVVKWGLEYEKASEEVPEPDHIKQTATKAFNCLDAYLLQA